MKFHEQLNAYIEQIDCMAKEVSEQSGVSAATLSRYRTGSRLPDTESDAFENLCSAIAELARQKQLGDITAESVREQFMQSSDLRPRDADRLLENFDLLLATLDVGISKLSRPCSAFAMARAVHRIPKSSHRRWRSTWRENGTLLAIEPCWRIC